MIKLILSIVILFSLAANANQLAPLSHNYKVGDIAPMKINSIQEEGNPYHPGAKAQDFSIETITIETTPSSFNYLEDVGDDESVVFFNFLGTNDEGYFRTILLNDKSMLFETSPKDVHYVFSTISTNAAPNEYINVAQALVSSFKSAIESSDDPDFWREHIHIATVPIQAQEGWIGEVYNEALNQRDQEGNLLSIPFMMALDKDGILRDGFRAAQSFGFLANVNGQTQFVGYDISYLGLEPWRYTYERQIDEQKLESDLVVPLFERSRSDGGWGGGRFNSTTITLPSRAELNNFDEMYIEFHTECGEDGYQYQCPAWDRDISLRLYKDGEFQQEIGRWITTYWRDGRWMTDISPLLANFNKKGVYELRYADVDRWVISASLRFRNTGAELRPTEIVKLWDGGQLNLNYNPSKEEINFEYDEARFPKAELVAFITGHGNGSDTKNCAEFCNNTHHFTINSKEYIKDHSNAGVSDGCLTRVSEGVTPLQSGTWYFGRAGWCPGQDVKLWRQDITDDLQAGNNTMNYKCLVDGIDFDPQVTNPDGYRANIKMTSYVVLWEPKVNLSIDKNQRHTNLVYPKITTSTLYINQSLVGNSVKSIRIFDNKGNEILNKIIAGETINVSNLSNGLYHIIVDTKNQRKISNFIKS